MAQVKTKNQGQDLKEVLRRFEADRIIDAINAKIHGELPKYAQTRRIEYLERDGYYGLPQVRIPFRFSPIGEEVQAVAYNLEGFISHYLGSLHINRQQEVRAISKIGDAPGLEYVLQIPAEGRGSPIAFINFRVIKDLHWVKFGGRVIIQQVSEDVQSWSSPYVLEGRTLEAYAQFLRPPRRFLFLYHLTNAF